jgi:short-subunit dehydrogenase
MSKRYHKSKPDLRGMTALVTGASRGVGAHIAEELAKEQMHLVLCARTERTLGKVAERLRQYGNQVAILPADLSRREELERLSHRATAVFGSIDVLVSNAAMACFLPYHRIRPEDLEKEAMVNYMAPMLLTRFLLPGMLARGKGHIVALSSLNAEVPLACLASYAATKAGVASFVRSLRPELAGTGVSASVVLPGVVWNEGMVKDFERNSEFRMTKLAGGCTPAQIARGVVRAIKHDMPEVIVNHPPVRPILILLRLMPKTMESLLRMIGVQEPSKAAAQMNVDAGGKITGVGIAPESLDLHSSPARKEHVAQQEQEHRT